MPQPLDFTGRTEVLSFVHFIVSLYTSYQSAYLAISQLLKNLFNLFFLKILISRLFYITLP